MELELQALLKIFDAASANLLKLERVWKQAEPRLPTSIALSDSSESVQLSRMWDDLLPGLPRIDGWTITKPLMTDGEVGQAFLDTADADLPRSGVLDLRSAPGYWIDTYRYRLNKARRRAVRARLEEVISKNGSLLRQIVQNLPDGMSTKVDTYATRAFKANIAEIRQLVADIPDSGLHWGNLGRHLSFSEVNDWEDIDETDWPLFRDSLKDVMFTDADPIPVPDLDLGVAASSNPVGPARCGAHWEKLTAEEFEKLVADLLGSIEGYSNVQLLMKTNAPDRGRDISCDRRLTIPGGMERVERVLVQAKHWSAKSVGSLEIRDVLSKICNWEPPIVTGLIFATSDTIHGGCDQVHGGS